jgi:hypothetical protein
MKQKKCCRKKNFKKDDSSLRFIYLFGFDNEDRLIFGDVVLPDDHPNAFERVISWAQLLKNEFENENIYFMIKVKEYKFVDISQRYEAYIEGWTDMKGTMQKVKGFIEAWKRFEEAEGGENPILKRYTVEFINNSLGLPFRYSQERRNLDVQELLRSEAAHKKS